jgi:hypothetical protein
MSLLSSLFKRKPEPESAAWSAGMGWRYVTYREGRNALTLQIEPMAQGADVVYVPDAERWASGAPAWARARAAEIVERLKSIAWNRELVWRVVPVSGFLEGDLPIAGSLESTPAGRQLEQLRLFEPNGRFTHAQNHEVWRTACRRFAEGATGRVTIFADTVVPDSVFQVIELAALKANPNVTLDFR